MPLFMELYIPGNSWVHRLDPRDKLIWLMTILIFTGFINNPFFLAPLIAWVIGVTASAKVSFKTIALVFKVFMLFIIIMIIAWPIFVHVGNVVLQIGPLPITDQGILVGLGWGMRAAAIMLCVTVVFMTTPQADIFVGFRELKIPHPIAFGIATGTRFIPAFLGELSIIKEAQLARGISAARGGLFTRIRTYVRMAFPLAVRLLKMARALSLAMDSKAFDVSFKQRTTYRKLTLRTTDKFFIAICISILVMTLIIRFILGLGWIFY